MKGGLLNGLTKKAPSSTDSSMTVPKASVNAEATRSTTAKTPRTLGPRDA